MSKTVIIKLELTDIAICESSDQIESMIRDKIEDDPMFMIFVRKCDIEVQG